MRRGEDAGVKRFHRGRDRVMAEEKKEQAAAQAGRSRRSFIKKAVVGGAVFTAPVIESLTKSDILVKSVAAASGPVVGPWIITTKVHTPPVGVHAKVFALNGTITPPGPVTVPDGGTQAFLIQSANNLVSIMLVMVDGASVPITDPHNMTYTFMAVYANHTLEATFFAVPT